jgi:hypothetical protein
MTQTSEKGESRFHQDSFQENMDSEWEMNGTKDLTSVVLHIFRTLNMWLEKWVGKDEGFLLTSSDLIV